MQNNVVMLHPPRYGGYGACACKDNITDYIENPDCPVKIKSNLRPVRSSQASVKYGNQVMSIIKKFV